MSVGGSVAGGHAGVPGGLHCARCAVCPFPPTLQNFLSPTDPSLAPGTAWAMTPQGGWPSTLRTASSQ